MADDSYTEVSGPSWFSRIANSIKNVLLGLLLFVAAFPLLVWNEGRAVRTAKTLEEGGATVVSVASDAVDPANEGKLVHVTGEATTTETLSDKEFGVSEPAVQLRREVQMYQWKEEKKTQTRNKIGGGKETTTTYTYQQAWSPELIKSASFKKPQGHANPAAMPVQAQRWTARNVSLGAFTLSDGLVARLDKAEPLPVDEHAREALPASLKAKANVAEGGVYIGNDAASPAVGDVKVTFAVVRPATASIVARQVSKTFEPYSAKAGGEILMLSYGTLSAGQMFKSAEEENAMLTWLLRLVGFVVMALGLGLILHPFKVLGDVLPFVGSLLGSGIAIVAVLIAGSLSLVTIAISWIVFRPLLGIGLLAVAAAAIAGVVHVSRRHSAAGRARAQNA